MSAQRSDQSGLWRQVGVASGLGLVLFGAIGAGCLMGWFLDSKLHTMPAFILVGGGLGLAAGIVELLQILNRVEKDDGGNDNRPSQD